MPDQIDRAAGLYPQSELFAIRRLRPEFVDGAELCRASVLRPKEDLDLSHQLRLALAARMTMLIGFAPLTAIYKEALATTPTEPLHRAIATGMDISRQADAIHRAIVDQADRVTIAPRNSTRSDIERLAEAGLSTPQIVALSELIAFVNFEVRVALGLKLLEDAA